MTSQRKSAAMVPSVIRVIRKSQGMTQQAVAELAGTSRRHIQSIEKGIKIPTLNTLDKIALALKVPTWVILRMGERL